MKEKHIHLVVLAIIGQYVLVADVSKSLTEFQKKLFHFLNQSPFKFKFEKWLGHAKKSHAIGIFENLVSVCSLNVRECNSKII